MRFVIQVCNKIGMSVVSPDTFVTMRKSALELLALFLACREPEFSNNAYFRANFLALLINTILLHCGVIFCEINGENRAGKQFFTK